MKRIRATNLLRFTHSSHCAFIAIVEAIGNNQRQLLLKKPLDEIGFANYCFNASAYHTLPESGDNHSGGSSTDNGNLNGGSNFCSDCRYIWDWGTQAVTLTPKVMQD